MQGYRQLARLMLALAVLLAAASPQSGPALDIAVLAAFDRHCATLDSADALAARIAGAGWAEFAPEADSDLGKLVGHTAGAMKEVPNFRYASRSFAPAGDHSIVAIVTTAGMPGLGSLECRIVATGAANAPDAATVASWAKRDATRTINQQGLASWEWEPGLRPTHGDTLLAHVDKDSPLRREFPLLGLIVQASRDTKQ